MIFVDLLLNQKGLVVGVPQNVLLLAAFSLDIGKPVRVQTRLVTGSLKFFIEVEKFFGKLF